MKQVVLIVVMLGFAVGGWSQVQFRVMTWNVENLFDCRHDTLKQDEEFLPESERKWTWGRYWRKIEDVSRVVMGVGSEAPPALVGLCEVENDSVMIALTRRGPLRALHYAYVMTDSPDVRGMDVALMYQPTVFRLLGHEARRVPSAQMGLRPTRDLLHAWGLTPDGDTLHVVVCHLPSRVGDSREGNRNRRLAVQTLRHLTDSLLAESPRCQILVMGDFNATLRDKALRVLWGGAFSKAMTSVSPFLPLTPANRHPVEGSYRFQGQWSWIDHILMSKALWEKHGAGGMARLYVQPWMQRRLNDGTWYPRRTYLGIKYNGGVSDHVPVYIELEF